MVKVKEFFQRYWLFILLAFLATVVAGIVIFFRQPEVPRPEPVELPSLTHPRFEPAQITKGRILYQLDLIEKAPEAPATLPVYQAKPRASFDYPIETDLGGKQIVTSTTQAAGLAKGFLNQNNRLTEELNQGEYQTMFFKIGGFEVYPANSFEEADIIAVHFYPKVNNLIVIDNNPFSALVEVWIGKNGKPRKVKDFLADYEPVEDNDYPIISFTEAWQVVTEQKGAITSLKKQEETYEIVAVKINTIIITKAYLAYFQSEELPASLQPVWVFQGRAILQDGTESEVAVYLPAIEEKYFTPGF